MLAWLFIMVCYLLCAGLLQLLWLFINFMLGIELAFMDEFLVWFAVLWAVFCVGCTSSSLAWYTSGASINRLNSEHNLRLQTIWQQLDKLQYNISPHFFQGEQLLAIIEHLGANNIILSTGMLQLSTDVIQANLAHTKIRWLHGDLTRARILAGNYLAVQYCLYPAQGLLWLLSLLGQFAMLRFMKVIPKIGESIGNKLLGMLTWLLRLIELRELYLADVKVMQTSYGTNYYQYLQQQQPIAAAAELLFITKRLHHLNR